MTNISTKLTNCYEELLAAGFTVSEILDATDQWLSVQKQMTNGQLPECPRPATVHRGDWSIGSHYRVGDHVRHVDHEYACILEHLSIYFDYPGGAQGRWLWKCLDPDIGKKPFAREKVATDQVKDAKLPLTKDNCQVKDAKLPTTADEQLTMATGLGKCFDQQLTKED